jgi:hypothetical protein
MNQPKFDWFRFWVHFGFGMALGIVFGFRVWIWYPFSSGLQATGILASRSILGGLAAGLNSHFDRDA